MTEISRTSRTDLLANLIGVQAPTVKLRLAGAAGERTLSMGYLSRGLIIGRSGNSDVVVPDHLEAVSRHHARVETVSGGVVVHDLSRNGVRVNELPVRVCRELRPGDRITLADVPSDEWSLTYQQDGPEVSRPIASLPHTVVGSIPTGDNPPVAIRPESHGVSDDTESTEFDALPGLLDIAGMHLAVPRLPIVETRPRSGFQLLDWVLLSLVLVGAGTGVAMLVFSG